MSAPALVAFEGESVILTDWRIGACTSPQADGAVTHMQLVGWLPEGWTSAELSGWQIPQRMRCASLPGLPLPLAPDLNVTVTTKGYGEPCKFMRIEWGIPLTGEERPS